jgi:hypothetical protein
LPGWWFTILAAASAAGNKEALSSTVGLGRRYQSSPAAIEGSVVSEILGNNFDAELENV